MISGIDQWKREGGLAGSVIEEGQSGRRAMEHTIWIFSSSGAAHWMAPRSATVAVWAMVGDIDSCQRARDSAKEKEREIVIWEWPNGSACQERSGTDAGRKIPKNGNIRKDRKAKPAVRFAGD